MAQPAITDNKDSTVTVRYAPSETGLPEMDIRYDNMHPRYVHSAYQTTSWGQAVGQTWG